MSNELKDQLSIQEISNTRSNIERIITSYRHVWDIYAELLQNSADAILEEFGEDNLSSGNIKLNIYPQDRKLVIRDNGIGLKEEELSKILVNGASLKRERDQGKYGFMGYGFTYVAFQTKYLQITSVKDGQKATRTYIDLYKFIYEDTDVPASLEEENATGGLPSKEASGTEVILEFPACFPDSAVEENLDATFRIGSDKETITAVLKTQTIIGIIDPLFTNNDVFRFELTIDNENVPIEPGFLTTREICKDVLNTETQFYDRLAYEKWIQETEQLPINIKDQARRAILIEEKIPDISIGERSPFECRILISATSKNNINTYNQRFPIDESQSYDFSLSHGSWLSICGMPLGICIDPFDHSNYLPYTVIVDIKTDTIRRELDAGRKGISTYRINQIKKSVIKLLQDHNFIRYRKYIVGGSDTTRIQNPLYNPRTELNSKISGKTSNKGLYNSLAPPIEEQEVITLFTELCVRDVIKGYKQLVLSGYEVYDGLFDYTLKKDEDCIYSDSNTLGISEGVFLANDNLLKKEILIEFKKDLFSIYSDIEENKKDLNHIDILVCWDVDYDNRERITEEKGDTLQVKDITANVYHGVTHFLLVANRQNALPVIELKKVLQDNLYLCNGSD